MKDFFSVPSPYLLPPNGRVTHSKLGGLAPLLIALDEVNFPPDLGTSPYWETKVGHINLWMRRFVIGEFIRKYINKRFDGCIMSRTWKKEVKERVRLEAKLWGETWKMIGRVYQLSIFAPDHHEALTFYKIILECSLLQPYLAKLSPEGFQCLTATAFVRDIQTQNKQLQQLGVECSTEIPFDRNSSPVTWQLIEQSRKLASYNDDFKAQYMAVVSARMSLATHIRGERPQAHSNYPQKVERRGRKPKGFNSIN